MINYKEYNVNPKHRKTGDCSTRAIAGTLGISWEEALRLQFEMSLKYCYFISNKETAEKVLAEYGYVKMKQPRKADGRKYSVNELDQILTPKQMQEGVCVYVANHVTCITGGYIQDIWNCGNKKVGNYFVRKG